MEDFASLSPVGVFGDQSLESRAQKVRYALAQLNSFTLSQSLMKEETWGQRLGSNEDMAAAERLLQQGAKSACLSLKTAELSEVQRLSLLSPAETAQVKVVHAKQKLSQTRTQQHGHGRGNQKY